ncbi:MAG: amino acid ABC transporter permease, partial [Phycicoccus sp.]
MRHPWRWVAVAAMAVLVAMIVSSFVRNERWNWSFAFEIMQQRPVIEGLWKGTVVGTIGAMVLGIGLGVVLAVMRLSSNPVLRGVAFVYTWFFRAIPRYVL